MSSLLLIFDKFFLFSFLNDMNRRDINRANKISELEANNIINISIFQGTEKIVFKTYISSRVSIPKRERAFFKTCADALTKESLNASSSLPMT